MSLSKDLKVLYHLALSPIRGKTHAERLESFYSGQADAYDDFRKRLLHGRQEMWRQLPIAEGKTLIDMGGGTGYNLEHIKDSIHLLEKVYLVDLSTSLLEVARKRTVNNGWDNVEAVEHDVTTFVPEEGTVDLVTFSYSLTMIPDWFAAMDQAYRLLKPGGHIGVVDFYVSRKYPAEGHKKHSWFTRSFWPVWMAMDNVFPCKDHVPFLHHRFKAVQFTENRSRPPYMPVKVPYYIFIGQKPE